MYQAQTLYARRKQRYKAFGVLVALVCMLSVLNLLTGASGLNFSDISKFEDENFAQILYHIRLPRVAGAILAGGLLGLSGAVMQGSLKNPLASPFTLGISQAAAFGASFAIIILQVYADETTLSAKLGVSLCAFLASVFCMAIIVFLGKISSLKPSSMILAGVGLGSLFHSLTMFLQYFADDLEVSATLFWTFGELGKSNWENIVIMAIVFIPIYIFFVVSHWKMDALSFGDESAKSRGVEVDKYRLISLLFSSFLSAVAVSFFGIIGFVGLVAPHIIRMILGPSHFSVLSLCALSGAVLLLLADFISKIILLPIILPIGIMTSFMGVPIFIYLLLKRAH